MEERMRYFDYDGNEDFRDDVDNFFNEESYFDEEDIMRDYLEVPHVEVKAKDPKPKILEMVRKTLEKNWFWRFRSPEYKSKKIAELYTLFYLLLYKTEIKIEDKEKEEKEDSE